MNQDFLAVLEYMEKEKGIERGVMLKAVESALVSACKKSFGPARNIRVEMDPKSGKISAWAIMKVVETITMPGEEIQLAKARQHKLTAVLGDTIEIEVTPKDFGRIAAQVFKQTINQNLRSIEKSMIYDEFKDRAGDIVTGTVRRFERQDVIVDLGKFEGIMPAKERVPTEEYSPGERVRALVLQVENTLRGPAIILSRSHPDFVKKLLELEVSELHDGTVQIKGLAREAGARTKIAVWSSDDKIDPVGACVGIRGVRVKNIVRELNNEKIDLFKWSTNIKELAVEAMKPARLKTIEIDDKNKRLRVTVDEENLSLAIGRKGQNARLASRLMGWEIDIEKEKVEAKGFEQQLEQALQHLTAKLEIDRELAQKIAAAGLTSIDDIVEADEEDIRQALPDLDDATIQNLREKAASIKQLISK